MIVYYAVTVVIAAAFGCGVLACWMAAGSACQALGRRLRRLRSGLR